MKLLFDQHISFKGVKRLQDYFPECKHTSDLNLNDTDDSIIWEYAMKNGYTIVTFDSDFFNLVSIKGCPPKLIWMRIGNTTTLNLINFFINKQEVIKDFILNPNNEDLCCLEFE